MKQYKDTLVGGLFYWIQTERGYRLASTGDMPIVFIDKKSHPEDFISDIPVVVDDVVDKGTYCFATVHQMTTAAPDVEVIAERMIMTGNSHVTIYSKGPSSFSVLRQDGHSDCILAYCRGLVSGYCYLPETSPELEKWDKKELSVEGIFSQIPSDQNRLMDMVLDSGEVHGCATLRSWLGGRVLRFDRDYSFISRDGKFFLCGGDMCDWIEQYADGPSQDATTTILNSYWGGKLTYAEVRDKLRDICTLPASLRLRLLRTSKRIMAEDELLDDAQHYALLRVMYEPNLGVKWITFDEYILEGRILKIAACFSVEEMKEIFDRAKHIMEEAKKNMAKEVKLHRMALD